MRPVFLFPLVFLLAACDPGFMPAGYAYHQNEYKAPDGPDAPPIGYDYTVTDNQNVVEAWQTIIADLVDRLERETGLIPQHVYLEPLPTHTAFNATYDHVLREELRGRGYALQPAPGDHFYIRYDAFTPAAGMEDPTADHGGQAAFTPETYAEGAATQKNIVLRLAVMRRGVPVKDVRAVYPVPPFGYQHRASHRPVTYSGQPVKGRWNR